MQRNKLKKNSFRTFLFLLFNLGIFGSGYAQVIDSTEQKPQLETLPQAAPARPPASVTPPARPEPTPTPAPPPAAPEQPEEPLQTKTKPDIREKLFIGGSGDLGFSSSSYYGSIFNIGASPLLGYRLTKFLAVGPGLVYNYFRINGKSFSDYGAKAFTQILLYKGVFLHGEHQILSIQGFDQNGQVDPGYRNTIQSTLAGAGYRQMASDRFGMDLYLLFNVANSTGDINSRPVFRVGFIYNLK